MAILSTLESTTLDKTIRSVVHINIKNPLNLELVNLKCVTTYVTHLSVLNLKKKKKKITQCKQRHVQIKGKNTHRFQKNDKK